MSFRKIFLFLCGVFVFCALMGCGTTSAVPGRSPYSYLPADAEIYVHMNLNRCPREILVKLKEFTGNDEILEMVDDILFAAMPKDNFFAAILGDFPKIGEKIIFSPENGFNEVPNTPGVYKQDALYFNFPQSGAILVSTTLDAFLFDNSNFSLSQVEFFERWIVDYGTSFFFSGQVLSKLSMGALQFSLENIFLGIKVSSSHNFMCDLTLNFPDEKTASLYLPIVRIFLSSMDASDNPFNRENEYTVEAEGPKVQVKNLQLSQDVILR